MILEQGYISNDIYTRQQGRVGRTFSQQGHRLHERQTIHALHQLEDITGGHTTEILVPLRCRFTRMVDIRKTIVR